jgi:hypothetical protein
MPHSIFFANGADGKARRIAFDKVFNFEALEVYYTKLQQVMKSFIFLFSNSPCHGEAGFHSESE